MSRRTVLVPDMVRRVRRDQRFLGALRSRIPEYGWRARGRCLELDPELFFPATIDDAGYARQACRTCSVAGPCLATALDAGDVEGVWGATTPEERRLMRQVWVAPKPSTRVPATAGR